MEKLAIYLNDHLAGSMLGVELAKRARDSNEGNAYGAELQRLAVEIAEDRASLLALMDELGVGKDRLKSAAGWLGEKIGRLKLNGSLLGYSPLSRLIELEGLQLGVTGKLSLWSNLRAAMGERVKAVELDELIARATSQLERLDAMRTRAAAEALTSG